MIDGLISADKETLKSLYAEIGRLKTILNGIEDLSQAEASSPHDQENRPAIAAFFEKYNREA